jgi:hypothetical protein
MTIKIMCAKKRVCIRERVASIILYINRYFSFCFVSVPARILWGMYGYMVFWPKYVIVYVCRM